MRNRRDSESASARRRPDPRAALRLLAAAAASASLAGCMSLPPPSRSSDGSFSWLEAETRESAAKSADDPATAKSADNPATVKSAAAPARSTRKRASAPASTGDPAVTRTAYTQQKPAQTQTPPTGTDEPTEVPATPALPGATRPEGPRPLGSPLAEAATTPAVDIRAPSIPPAPDYPIDLPTALRLAERANPQIGAVRARVGEALGNQMRARAELLPALNAGADYDGVLGNIQQSKGQILNLSRQSVYFGGGAFAVAPMAPLIPAVFINEPLANALYDPLAAHQMVHVAQFEAAATTNVVLLEVTRYYLDLLGATARLEADRRTADEAAELMRITERYAREGEGRPSDFHRAQAEWRLRRALVRRDEEDRAVASARLCHRLHLEPSVQVRALADQLDVLALVDLEADVRALIDTAMTYRPEIKAAGANLAAADVRRRQEVARPFLPTLWLGFSGAAFGGGSNIAPPLVGNFAGRTDFDVAAFWTLENLGFGNLALQKERRAEVGAAIGRQTRTIALVRQEVASAYGEARARLEQVEIARERYETALDGFRHDFARARQADPNRVGGTPRPIEVINSLKLLAEARRKLVSTIVDYDQEQFRLFVALGAPPPLEQPTNPRHQSVAIRNLAAPVTTTPAPTPDAPAAPTTPAVAALTQAESELQAALQRLTNASGRPGDPAAQFAELARAHRRSMDTLLEYDRLQETIIRSLGPGAPAVRPADQVDRLLGLREAHRKLIKARVDYDETLWNLVRSLGTKGQVPAPAVALDPSRSQGEAENARMRAR